MRTIEDFNNFSERDPVPPICHARSFLLHQHNTLGLNLPAELLRDFVPHKQIHPKRQVAFLKSFPENGNPAGLLRGSEDH